VAFLLDLDQRWRHSTPDLVLSAAQSTLQSRLPEDPIAAPVNHAALAGLTHRNSQAEEFFVAKSKFTRAAKSPKLVSHNRELYALMSRVISLREQVAQAELRTLHFKIGPKSKSHTASAK